MTKLILLDDYSGVGRGLECKTPLFHLGII